VLAICQDRKMNQRLWFTVTLIGFFLLAAAEPATAQESAPSCQPTHPQGGWVSNGVATELSTSYPQVQRH
jgi:hypothetical protein